jgi:peptidoglycan/LPS O-acetylase OafA/YrhL
VIGKAARPGTLGRIDVTRNHQLDGLRGYAAVMVSVFHTILCMDETLIPRIVYGEVSKLPDAYSWFAKVILKLFSGETAVFIFFVLSGTVLFQSLMSARRPLLPEALIFTVRRLLRIYPALIICLAVMALYSVAVGHPVSLYDFAVNSTLYAFPINGVTWTLNVEVVAVGFILAAYVGWRVGSEWGLIAAAVGIGIALRFPWLQSVAVTFKNLWVFFVLGMLIPTRIGGWIARMLPMMAWPFILLIVVIFKSTLQQGAIALLVVMLYYKKAGALGQVLEKPVAQFLGRISYSFYLYNFLVFTVVCGSLKQWPLVASHPVEAGLLASVPVIAITILFAYFSTRFVEVPGIEFGRAISSMPTIVRQTR